MEVPGGHLGSLVEAFLLVLYLGGVRRELDPGSFGKLSQRFAELDILLLHDEGEDVSTGAAGAKAMPVLGVWIDVKRRLFFAMERTEGTEQPPGLGEMGILPNYLDYVNSLLYFVNYAHTA
jgi:hypothetical protein